MSQRLAGRCNKMKNQYFAYDVVRCLTLESARGGEDGGGGEASGPSSGFFYDVYF